VSVALTLGMLLAGIVDARAAAAPANLTLTPSQGTPAQLIQADGKGFCTDPAPACGTVTISFQGAGEWVRNIPVSSSGTFSIQFQPPAGAPGSRTVTATQSGPNGKEAITTFTLTLQPTGVPPPRGTPTPSQVVSPAPAPAPTPAPTAAPEATGSASPSPSSPEPAVNGGGGGPTTGSTASGPTFLGLPSFWIMLLLLLFFAALGILAWRLLRRRGATGGAVAD
jgi:hypothetical protein